MTSVLITGADGFIGKVLCQQLVDKDFPIIEVIRATSEKSGYSPYATVGNIDATTNWQSVLQDVDVVIHLAARVHITNDSGMNSLAEFRKTNLDGTVNLAEQAVKAGVKRFIFISSIKVNGEVTKPGLPFTAEDIPSPVDAYGISKLEAEEALRILALETNLQVVIIRPPIVYGPGVKANFLALMSCLYFRIPLPLGAINNQRSILAVDNLVDLIITCVSHPAAANQTLLVRDEKDISTTELLHRLARVMGKKAYLLPIPVSLIRKIALFIGKKDIAQKLCDSLQVDMTKTYDLLNWTPPVSTDDALLKTARHYMDKRK